MEPTPTSDRVCAAIRATKVMVIDCDDIDEYETERDDCHADATCSNTRGYQCDCDGGYEGDGLNCADIDECRLATDDCDPNAVCDNTAGVHLYV